MADLILNEMNLDDMPYVEDTCNSLLASFIYFAANNCAYKGGAHDLIVTSVKATAAASKEGDPYVGGN